MMIIFDYIYYRWFLWYKGKDNDPSMSASVIVSAYQLLTIINIVLLTTVVLGVSRPSVKYLIGVIVILCTLNSLRCVRGFDITKLEERWGNESRDKKKLRAVMLIAYLIITFFIPWIYGFATN